MSSTSTWRGEITEKEYFTALGSDPRYRARAGHGGVTIQVVRSQGHPEELVRAACWDKEHSDYPEEDQYWCVFDVEAPEPHPHLRQACQRAERAGVRTAVSNPCFELWLILHHRDHWGYLTTAQAGTLRNQLDRSVSKHINSVIYMDRRAEAAQRARSLRGRHERDRAEFPADNPSSGVDLLLDALDQAALPRF
ncbi:RloB domain-containing protein [Actinomyces sp. 2119]|uniref:RloB domain-containing protein n=1 Tax=Actinomyces lilanjuaniae TaxID=2321394 RepID=A0ABN5PQA3_9ACTO|nr:RloB family protein [Actinomyces sp. 2119]AYD90555.1 RloB domain-containing protein [Actinomyces lilanjuaniae]RJF43993.1 RloB domain-containing protein [Actinomyces sp. 2119]